MRALALEGEERAFEVAAEDVGRVAIFSRTVRMLRQITSIGLVMSERTWRVVPWTAWPARSNASSPVPSAAAAPVASIAAS